jgi:hypothetical protein
MILDDSVIAPGPTKPKATPTPFLARSAESLVFLAIGWRQADPGFYQRRRDESGAEELARRDEVLEHVERGSVGGGERGALFHHQIRG